LGVRRGCELPHDTNESAQLRRAGKTKTAQIYVEVAEAAPQQQRWTAAGLSKSPAVISSFEQHKSALAQFSTDIDQLQQVLACELSGITVNNIQATHRAACKRHDYSDAGAKAVVD
jgi:hypothetical protein